MSLDIEELSLDGETLRLRGSTKTYEDVEAVKRGLAARPEFRNVEAKDVRASVDGQRVDFRLSLEVGEEAIVSALTDLLQRSPSSSSGSRRASACWSASARQPLD